jgi:hypothetical protein
VEVKAVTGAEGGADQWARPELKPISPSRDTIGAPAYSYTDNVSLTMKIPVFQQIDIEVATDTLSGGTSLRMYGVTEVLPPSPEQNDY